MKPHGCHTQLFQPSFEILGAASILYDNHSMANARINIGVHSIRRIRSYWLLLPHADSDQAMHTVGGSYK